ncbi:hypothetical protein LOK49_LG08G02623 [Camellia lanceoleosa]|uniref:Uncharacterized protein n=1 Tax=Camellia lanceoleosa TaxID=1840588 RepID=A0ACC0GS06_9ERIC|nr:hypothetical protein LOK49_LG08G02623 [Camellia lanceoleosa]
MSHHHPRQILTPLESRKRKEREVFYAAKPLAPPVTAVTTTTKAIEPASSNRLLAGYMAYEYLTKGTLFGQKWDPARAGAVPVSNSGGQLGESKKTKAGQSQSCEAEPRGKVVKQQEKQQQQPHQERYAVVSNLLKEDGAHVPGIVNPTQLARWIQM